MSQANQKFERTTAKLYQIDPNGKEKSLSLLSYKEAKEAYATSLAISIKIKEWEKTIRKNQKNQELDLSNKADIGKFASIRASNKYNSALQQGIGGFLEKEQPTVSKNQSLDIEVAIITPFTCPKPEELKGELDRILKDIEGSLANPSAQTKIRMQIEYLVEQLEIPDLDIRKSETKSYWEEIPKKDLKESLNSFSKLLRYYFQTTYMPILNLPEQQNCYYALYAFIHKLAVRMDELKEEGPKLGDYGIHFHLTETKEEAFSTFYEEKTYNRYKKICAYFTECQKNCIILNKSNFRSSDQNKIFNLSSPYRVTNDEGCIEENSELHYYKELLNIKSVQDFYEKVKLHPAINEKIFSNPKMAKIADMATITTINRKNLFTEFGLEQLLYLREASVIINLVINCDHYKRYNGKIDPNSLLESDVGVYSGIFIIDYKCFSLSPRSVNRRTQPFIDMYGIDMDEDNSKKDPSPLVELLWPKNKKAQRREKLVEAYEDEGKRLIATEEKNSLPVSDLIIRRSSCIPELQPITLIKEFIKHCDIFDQKINQQAFEIFLFKHFDKGHPFFSEIRKFLFFDEEGMPKEATALQKQCEEFIRTGIKIFYDCQPGGQPKVHAALFFLRLSIHLKNALQGAKIKVDFDERKILQKWIRTGAFETKELYAIHIHLIGSYALEPVENISQSQIEEITASWLYIQAEQEDQEWLNPSFKNFVTSWFYKTLSPSLAKKFKEDEKQKNHSLNGALALLGIQTSKEYEWKAIKKESEKEEEVLSLCYELKLEDSGFLKVNLLTGAICNENGTLIIPKDLPFLNHQCYRTVFGNKKYPTTMSQGTYYFTTPDFGPVRIRQKEKEGWEKEDHFIIERKEGNSWYQYIDSSDSSMDELPKALKLKGYSHWFPLDADLNQPFHFEIRANGKPYLQAKMNEKKMIEKINIIDHETGKNHLKLENLDSYPCLKETVNLFELPCYTLLSSRESGSLKLEFPRITSLNGSPLLFEQSLTEKSAFVWKENQKLHLRSIERGLIECFENYLTLAAEEGEIKKLLIPLVKIGAKNQFPSKNLNLELDNPDDSKAEKGCRSYIEIDLNNREPQSQTDEGWLFLAYLSLCQKKYEKSLNYLKKIKASDQLSENSLKIISWIQDSHSTVKDKSANGAALRLQAYSHLLKTKSRPELFYNQEITEDKKIKELLSNDLSTYIDGLNHVHSTLLLSKNRELKLIQSLSCGQSFIKNRINFLEKGEYLKEEALAPKQLTNSLLENETFDSYSTWLNDEVEAAPFMIMRHSANFEDSFKDLYLMARSGTELEKNYVQFIVDNVQRKEKEPLFNLYKYLRYALIMGEKAPAYQKNVRRLIAKLSLIEKKDLCPFLKENQEYHLEKVHNSSTFEKEILFRLNSLEKVEISEEFEKPLKFDQNLENPSQKKVEELKKLSQELAKSYFKEKIKKENERMEFIILEELQDKRYKQPLESSTKEFQEEYETGRLSNFLQPHYLMAEGKKLNELGLTLKEELKGLEEPFLNLEKKLLSLANKESPIKEVALRERLLVEGGSKQLLQLGSLVRLFLKGEAMAIKEANPHLSSKEIGQLYTEIGNYLLLKSEKQNLERALNWIAKIEKSKDRLVQESLTQKLAETLFSKISYIPQDHIECLILESQGNIRIRKKQFELIEEMIKTTDEGIYKNLAIQLFMGGGKTSVLASILGILSTRKKRLPLFIVPSALYKTVKGNMQKTQLENFGQEVTPIDLERKKFTSENLKWIEKELKKSIRKGKMVLMKPEMIQSLCLEFIFLLDQHADSESNKNKEELAGKIETLRSILNIFRTQTDALGDEIDQLLNTLKAVNFPGGEEMRVEQTRIDLVKEIYKIATDENEGLSAIIGLKTNKQTLLSENDYKTKVMPAIAQALIYYDPIAAALGKNKELNKSCLRYLCNQIEPKLQEIYTEGKSNEELTNQEKQDLAFLSFLDKLSLSNDEKDQEAANLIALSRHIINETLPGTLSKNGNRHYGRKSRTNAKVVPYLGVGSPATTQFADHYRAICFHYQTAILEGISANQILELAQATMAAALHSAKKLKIPFNETKEAINFKKATGIDLHLIERAGNLEKAVSYVNESPKRQLDLESFTIAGNVTFHSKRLNSTPHMFFDQFGGGSSFRGFSGTTWNDSTYPEGLEVKLDKGSDGKIADLLLERDVPVHKTESDDPATILTEILKNHKTPDRIRGIIDAGGEFKKYENSQVAEKILESSEKFEAVIFFGKAENQSTPDTLFILKNKSKEPIAIKSTDLEAILAKGVALDKIFFYYDERHTTGTDFVQIPDAINLITVGEKSFKRDFDQGAMRLRELFLNQEIEVILNRESSTTFINGGEKIEDVILTSVKIQAIAKADQTIHSYFEQMENGPKRHALKNLLDNSKSVEEISKIYRENQYQKIFITDVKDEPYKLYGELRKEINTIDGIKERAEKLKNEYKDNESVIQEIDRIVKRAIKSPSLPEKMMSPISEQLGQGEEIEICSELKTEQQTDQEREMQLEMELQQEIDLYSQKSENKIRKESVWDPVLMLTILKGDLPESYVQLSINELFESGSVKYQENYGKIFDQNQIFVTENFRLTYEEPVSVFDKAQKPGNQILFIQDKEGKMKALLPSYYEAHQFREYLTKIYLENWNKKQEERMEGIDRIWLSGDDGELFLNNPFAKLDKKEKQIVRILLQVNLFNGNIKYLDEREKETSNWIKENYELKLRYLKLKVEKNERARKILYYSDFLMKN